MVWDPYTSKGRDNLRLSIEQSYKDMRFARRTRRRLLDLFVGNHYGKEELIEEEVRLMNLTYQAGSIYTSWLVAEDPVGRAKTDYRQFLPFAKRYEVNLNQLAKRINITNTLRDCVLESTLKWGICKVGLGSSEFVRMDTDAYSDPGFPFAASLELDNTVVDMRSTKVRQSRYIGDYYEVGEDILDAEKLWDKKTREKLLDNIRRNEDVGERARDISVNPSDYDLFCRHARLIDIWIPWQRKIYTFDANLDYKPLNVVDYDGNSEGPYKFLSYDDVPGNVLPVSPLENLIDLDEACNSLMRKNLRKARSLKEVMGFSAASKDDAEAVRSARDGEYVRMDDPKGVNAARIGGVDQNLFQFNLSLLEQFNRMGGNIMTLAGLGAQTKTVGQEQLLNEQVGALMQKMQRRVVKFASEIYGELGYHLWNDKVGFKASMSLADLGLPNVHIDQSWNPDHREGDIVSYYIEVEPNSMIYQSSQQKMAIIDDCLLNKAIPMMQTPFGTQAGMTLDPRAYIQTASNLHNIPELREIIKFTGESIPDPPTPEVGKKTTPNGGVYIHKGAGSQPKDPQAEIMERMTAANADNKNSAA